MSDPIHGVARFNRLLSPEAATILRSDHRLLNGLIAELESGSRVPFLIGPRDIPGFDPGRSGPDPPPAVPPTPDRTQGPFHTPPEQISTVRGPEIEVVERTIREVGSGSSPAAQVHDLHLSSDRTRSKGMFDAREFEGEFKVTFDPMEHMGTKGRIEDFHKLFQDRYRTMRDILRRQYGDLHPLEDIGSLSLSDDRTRVIGMVQDIRTSKNGHLLFELEDPSGVVKVLISKKKDLFNIHLVEDETVGIIGRYSKDAGSSTGIIFADEVHRPDVPALHRRATCTDEGAIAAFISDIHVGSRHFLSREWKKMIRYLNGEDTGTLPPSYSARIKYLVVNGDLVDGIGIYPEQEKDLDVKDISKQYEILARIMSDIPSHIHIVLVPGNHDAVRLAEPQPPLPREFVECFSNDRVHFVTNPAFFSLSGVTVTAYHGKSIDDMVQTYKDVTYEDPIEGMREMLRSRHLGLTYGMRNQLSPEEMDMLILREVPDIFVTGHVHRFGQADYKGISMIQAGTWQSQTDFQRMMNFKPQPARMALVDLTTREVSTWQPRGLTT